MKKLKIIAFLLLFSVISTLVIACSDTGESKSPEDTTTAGKNGENIESEAAETEPQRPDLPKETFGGYEFRFLSRGTNYPNDHWRVIDTVPLEEKSGDVINDAVLLRNQYIEETYDVKISMINTVDYSAVESTARKNILANDDFFDVFNDSISIAGVLASQGHLIDLKTIPYLGLSNPWWDQNANAQLSLTKKLFMTTNNMTLMDKSGTWVVLFTKGMIDKFTLEVPYDLVAQNKWTMDKMYEMATAVTYDVDGDGVMTENDSWGLLGEPWNVNAMMAGAGTRIFSKDADDMPVFTMASERVYSAFEKAYNLMGGSGTVYLATSDVKKTYVDIHLEHFGMMMQNNLALFYITGMNRVFLFRGIEADFGILPNAKYNEQQESYYLNMSYGNSNCIAVPITNTDLTRTGIILEAITYESSITSYPAYIETSVRTKYTRDVESLAMLDIIYASRIFDLGHIFAWGGANTIYSNLITSKSPDIVSNIAKSEPNIMKAMEKTLALFEELN